jgi:UPF0755 protein
MRTKTRDNNTGVNHMKKRVRRTYPLITSLFLFLCIIMFGLVGLFIYLPQQVGKYYGPPSGQLNPIQNITYKVRLLIYKNDLTIPLNINGNKGTFIVKIGESVGSIAIRLEEDGYIRNDEAFRLYLIYKGLDISVQAGEYQLSAAISAIEIANRLQDATPEDVAFIVLPGWRLEEIAAALPTSGLVISPELFIQTARDPSIGVQLGLPPLAVSFEGFLFPDKYRLRRDITAQQMIQTMFSGFNSNVTPEIRQGFQTQGLSLYEGVVLASMVQKEAVIAEEQPLIASVFFNRLAANMALASDPTIQYALGYDNSQNTWWKNPLTANDLHFDSPFNTYLSKGLPPGPIANPAINALRAVAFPANTSYYYFRARCDGSKLHNFAQTYEEHLNNACP